MGRFDNLTQLERHAAEEKDRTPASPQVDKQTNPQTHLPSSPQVDMTASGQADKPTNPQVHQSASGQPITSLPEKAERYTTRLQPSLIKLVKRYAFDHDINDYDVVQNAIRDYLKKYQT